MRHIAAFLVSVSLAGCQYPVVSEPKRTVRVTVTGVTLNHRQTLLHGTDSSGKLVRINCDQGAYGRRVDLGVPQEFKLVRYHGSAEPSIDCNQ